MCLLILLRQVPLPHQVRLHRHAQGCLELRGNPEPGWILDQVHSTQLQRLKWDSIMHTLAGWRKSSRETSRMRKNIFQKNLVILNLSLGITSLLLKLTESQNNKEATLEHFFAIPPQTSSYTEAVYDMVRKIGRPTDDPMEDLDVHVATWGVFMKATPKAAVYLGNDHDVNLRHEKNSSWSSTGQLFGKTEKLISGQTETTGIRLIDSEDLRWISTSLLHSRAYQYANAKVYVFSDSVPCLGKCDTILLGPGRNKFSGIQTPTTSANWIELMEKPWSSSGRSSQDSRQRVSSTRFRKRWANHRVIHRTSKAGSSSCQWSTTLYVMRKGN